MRGGALQQLSFDFPAAYALAVAVKAGQSGPDGKPLPALNVAFSTRGQIDAEYFNPQYRKHTICISILPSFHSVRIPKLHAMFCVVSHVKCAEVESHLVVNMPPPRTYKNQASNRAAWTLAIDATIFENLDATGGPLDAGINLELVFSK
jgi:hypothetical protein